MTDYHTTAAIKGGEFPATRWSLVLQVRDASEATANGALEELCKLYWRPVYSFLRRQGNSPHDAEDLTQGFFVSLLQREAFAQVEEAKGRLRSFLLVAVKRFAASQHERNHALKRGGEIVHVPIDMQDAEEHYSVEPVTHETPEFLFDKQWALALLRAVMLMLQDDYTQSGRGELFRALKDRLTSDRDPDSLQKVADQLGMTHGAIRTAVSRLRERCSTILHHQIAQTVRSKVEVREEIEHLLRVLGSAP